MKLIVIIFTFLSLNVTCIYSQNEKIVFKIEDEVWNKLDKDDVYIYPFEKIAQEITINLAFSNENLAKVSGDRIFQELFGEMQISFESSGIDYSYGDGKLSYLNLKDTLTRLQIPNTDRKIKVSYIEKNNLVDTVTYQDRSYSIFEFFCETPAFDDFPYILGFLEDGHLLYVAVPMNEFYYYDKTEMTDEVTRLVYWRQ